MIGSQDRGLYGEADIPAATRIIYGPGRAFSDINDELDALDTQRAFLVTGRTLGASELVARFKEALGPRLCGHYARMGQHSPRHQVIEAARLAREAGADVLVAIGGGSSMVGTKGVALVMAEGEDMDQLRAHYDYNTRTITVPKLSRQKLPVICIPTTLSAGEFSSAMGISNATTGQKDKFIDPGVVPRVVFLDPEMTIATPPDLWASTGIKALQNGVERYYARNANPFVEGLCLEAIRVVFRHLVPSIEDPTDLDARGRLQFLNWMTAFGAGKGGIGLGHGICHQLGSVCGIGHGISGCVVLPHMMRFNRPVTLERQRIIAEAMGFSQSDATDQQAAEWAEETVRALVRRLNLPATLSQAGVRREDLPRVAELTLQDRTLSPTPRPPQDAGEVERLLAEMYD